MCNVSQYMKEIGFYIFFNKGVVAGDSVLPVATYQLLNLAEFGSRT